MDNAIDFVYILERVQLVRDAPSAKGEEVRVARTSGNVDRWTKMGVMKCTLRHSIARSWTQWFVAAMAFLHAYVPLFCCRKMEEGWGER